MKWRLWFILLLLPFALEAQIGRYPFSNSAHLGGEYCAQYQAVYDAMTNKPTEAIAGYQNTMVNSLIDGGYWIRIDGLWVYAQYSNAASEALINWVTPGTFNCTEVGAGSLVFTSLEGLTGDGTNYLTTNYDPATNGVNYLQDDATLAVYIRNDVASSSIGAIGRDAATNDAYILPQYGGDVYYRINDASTETETNASSQGFIIVTRTASNTTEVYKNGNSLGSNVTTSTGVTNVDFCLFTRDGSSMGIYQIAIAIVMDGVSDAEAAAITTIIETYMDAIGTGVIP